ncbi:hypothetical protein BpHYR1_024569 [Brachionus plicatilis]|uniref:Uncharacterized protein n=1 Tax=Brachionus plicatilis TaxID=10195 RepID=A0A3M7SYJ2_BRAPC|nr:hypothetical protein BpHYR1_024569 [Brachionus plicatilis]
MPISLLRCLKMSGRFQILYHLIHPFILVLHFQSIGHNQPVDTKMNRNFLKENWNESHTLKKLRNRRIINPILNSDTIDSNVQTTEKDN